MPGWILTSCSVAGGLSKQRQKCSAVFWLHISVSQHCVHTFRGTENHFSHKTDWKWKMSPGKKYFRFDIFTPYLKYQKFPVHRMSTSKCTDTGELIRHPSPVVHNSQSCDATFWGAALYWPPLTQVQPCWSQDSFLRESLSILTLTPHIDFPSSTSLSLILVSFDLCPLFLTWLIFCFCENIPPKWSSKKHKLIKNSRYYLLTCHHAPVIYVTE